jgi:hypothetical protein
MKYVVQARRAEPGTGTFEAGAKTKEDALERARDLRSQGLKVRIFRPDGNLLDDETEGLPRAQTALDPRRVSSGKRRVPGGMLSSRLPARRANPDDCAAEFCNRGNHPLVTGHAPRNLRQIGRCRSCRSRPSEPRR